MARDSKRPVFKLRFLLLSLLLLFTLLTQGFDPAKPLEPVKIPCLSTTMPRMASLLPGPAQGQARANSLAPLGGHRRASRRQRRRRGNYLWFLRRLFGGNQNPLPDEELGLLNYRSDSQPSVASGEEEEEEEEEWQFVAVEPLEMV